MVVLTRSAARKLASDSSSSSSAPTSNKQKRRVNIPLEQIVMRCHLANPKMRRAANAMADRRWHDAASTEFFKILRAKARYLDGEQSRGTTAAALDNNLQRIISRVHEALDANGEEDELDAECRNGLEHVVQNLEKARILIDSI